MTPATLRSLVDALDCLDLRIVTSRHNDTMLECLATDQRGLRELETMSRHDCRRTVMVCWSYLTGWSVSVRGVRECGHDPLPMLRRAVARWPA